MSKILSLCFVLGLCVLGVGCATTQNSDEPFFTPAKVEKVADSIVATFTIVRLKSHPDSKPAFVVARDSLNDLVARQEWDLTAFSEILLGTGLFEEYGDDAVLYITTGVNLVNVVTGEKVDLSKVENVKALIQGGSSALNRVVK